jgi:hypothetical protein
VNQVGRLAKVRFVLERTRIQQHELGRCRRDPREGFSQEGGGVHDLQAARRAKSGGQRASDHWVSIDNEHPHGVHPEFAGANGLGRQPYAGCRGT